MKSSRVALLAFAFAVSISHSKEPPPKPLIIDVTVLDAKTNKPIPGVPVQLTQFSPYALSKLTTNELGTCRLSLSDTRPGWAALGVSHTPYLPQTFWWNTKTHGIQVPETITIKLEKGITIGGNVLDESGNPVADVGVNILMTCGVKTEPSQNSESLSTRVIKTDAHGKWTFSGAFPACYHPILWVYASREGFAPSFSRRKTGDQQPSVDPKPFYNQMGKTYLVHKYINTVRQNLPTARTEEDFLRKRPTPVATRTPAS